jgi:chitodextrinase
VLRGAEPMTVRMWGAAPRVGRIVLVALVAAALLGVFSGTSSARVDFGRADAQPASFDLWAVEVNARNVAMLRDRLAERARKAGLNTVLIDERQLTKRQWVRVTRLVKHFGFRAVFLGRAVKTTNGAEAACKRMKQRDHAKLCALVAPSWGAATKLAAAPDLDVVILRMQQLGGLKVVRDTGTHAKVLALVDIGRTRKLDPKAWRDAIVRAGRDPSFDLAVAPVGSSGPTALTSYISLLGDSDVSAPSVPAHLALVDATQNSLHLSWTASEDDHGVTEYGIYRSDVLVSSTANTTATLGGLACGTNYLIQIDAADAAGNRSAKTSLQGSTAPCPPPSGPPPADGQPPSKPTGLTMTASTPSTISLAWNASSDNVGVAGYGLFVGPSAAGETPATTATFSGLTCGTSYNLSVDAYDGAGNRSEPSTVTAWTSPCPTPDTTPPTQPTGLIASVTATTITLSWNPSSDNLGVAGYSVYSNGSLVGNAASPSFTLAGLACAKSYTLSVDAYDANGNRSGQSSLTVSTGACPIADTTAPTIPTGLAAGGATGTSLALHWNASTDNVGVSGYGVYIGALNLVNTTSTMYVVSGLACGTSYTFGVDAYDVAGNRSSKASLTTSTSACPAPDTTPPSVPGSLNAATATQNSVTLTWSASTDNTGVSGYTVYNGASSVGSTGATSFTVSGLTCGTNYTLSVDAYDAAGNRSAKASVATTTSACPAADTTPPSAPTGLAVSSPTQTSITLSWNASTDNVGVAGYGRYRNGSLVSNATGTSFTFGGLTCGTSYTLAVDAYDAAGNRSAASSLTASTTACPDTQTPSTPGGLSASGATQTAITLSWNASTDNVGVTGYGRYRNNSLVSSGTGTSYTFTGLSCGTTYTLAVDAYDAAGNRSGKGSVSASTAACPAADTTPPTVPQGQQITAATATSVTMTWLASTDNVGVAGYRVYLNNTLMGSTQSLTYTYTGLVCGTTYTVALEAYDAAGNASNRALAQGPAATAACPPDTQPPTAPPALATTGATQTSISIGWGPSIDNVGVVGYTVYNGGTAVGSTASTAFTVTGLACGTSYTLAVDAYDSLGNRSPKTSIAASTSACAPPPPPPPSGGGANLWMDTNSGSCTRQASPGGYVDAQACGSMQAALDAAQSGDVVNIVDGTYGSQGLSGSKQVTFRAAGPGRPNFGQIINAGSNNTIKGIQIENRNDFNGPCTDPENGVLFPCGTNETYDDVVIDGLNKSGNHGIAGVGDRFTLKNSEIRNIVDAKGFEGGADDMLIENNYWHNIRVVTDGVHNECVYVDGGDRSVFRGNLFIGCPTMALFFTNWNGGAPYSNVTVENNIFGHTLDTGGNWHGSCSFKIGWGANNQNTVIGWVVRYNTFEVAPCLDGTPAGGDTGAGQYYGNLGGIQCESEMVYKYNVGQTCGGVGELSIPNAVNDAAHPNQAPFYVNAPGGDFHLLGGAAAINKGDPTRYPSVDRDGKARPIAGAPDAGAYEFG